MKGDITAWGQRIVDACPAQAPGIGMRSLIERLHGLGDYGGYQRGIEDLVKSGYLHHDKRMGGYWKGTKK
jgi:hypothetical protein